MKLLCTDYTGIHFLKLLSMNSKAFFWWVSVAPTSRCIVLLGPKPLLATSLLPSSLVCFKILFIYLFF